VSKIFTLEVQTNAESAGYSARGGLHVYTMPDDWTSEMIAKHAAKDHEKTATDDLWRIVVWNGDATQDQLRDPDWVIYGHELAGDCWCHPLFIQNGEYEWWCPSHGDRSWRPAAKAFQAGLSASQAETVEATSTIHENYRKPYAAWLSNWPIGTPDEPYWPAFADAIDAARKPLVAEIERLREANANLIKNAEGLADEIVLSPVNQLADFARWLISMDAMNTEAGWTLRKTVSLNDIIERAREALGEDA
jgi:hypothetical protein